MQMLDARGIEFNSLLGRDVLADAATKFIIVAVSLLGSRLFLFCGGVHLTGSFLERKTATHHLEGQLVIAHVKGKKGRIYPCSYTSNQSQAVTSGKVLVPGTTHRTVGTVQGLHTRQVRLATTSRAGQGTTSTAVVHTVAGTRRRATGPAVLPDLPQFPTQLLTGHSPVVLDIVPELHHVSLDLQFILLQPRDIEFLAGGTALELTGDVLIVVSDNAKKTSR